MGRVLAFLYGLICYLLFLGTILYAIGFVGNLVVPKSIDSGIAQPLIPALIINALLLAVFAIQHSVMARQGFKRMWTKVVPPVVERSTFVLLTCGALILLYWKWVPIEGVIWNVENATGQMVLMIMFAMGWALVFFATFLIDHFELFGLKQVVMHMQKKTPTPPEFEEKSVYKNVRHPLYLGMVIAFWSTPTMTTGHLIFAIATTAYIFVGIFFEERDLMKVHGQQYASYRKRIPMIIPFTKFGKSGSDS